MMSRWSTDVPSSTFEGSERPVDRVFESHQPHFSFLNHLEFNLILLDQLQSSRRSVEDVERVREVFLVLATLKHGAARVIADTNSQVMGAYRNGVVRLLGVFE
jgi:hypothetical protein